MFDFVIRSAFRLHSAIFAISLIIKLHLVDRPFLEPDCQTPGVDRQRQVAHGAATPAKPMGMGPGISVETGIFPVDVERQYGRLDLPTVSAYYTRSFSTESASSGSGRRISRRPSDAYNAFSGIPSRPDAEPTA